MLKTFNISNCDQIVKVLNIKLHRYEDKKIRVWEKSLFPCVHSTLYSLECTAKYTMHSAHTAEYSVHCTLYSLECTAQYTMHSTHTAEYSVHLQYKIENTSISPNYNLR